MATNLLFPFMYGGAKSYLSDADGLSNGFYWIQGSDTSDALTDSGFIHVFERGTIAMQMFYPANNQTKILYRYRVSLSSGYQPWRYISTTIL